MSLVCCDIEAELGEDEHHFLGESLAWSGGETASRRLDGQRLVFFSTLQSVTDTPS